MRPLVPSVCALLCAFAAAQPGYRRPPEPIERAILAPPPPQTSVSPARTHVLLLTRESMPSIEILARPILALAGQRIDPHSRGPQRGTRGIGLELVTIADGARRRFELPADPDVGDITWAADGTRFAFTNTVDDGIEAWIADVETARCRKLEGLRLVATLGDAMRWLPDGQRLLCLVRAGDAAAPERPRAAPGPIIEESSGKKAPVRTYQDLLQDAHDEALFEHYMTAQLTIVDPRDGKQQALGTPGIFASHDASPNGEWLLVTRLRRPFSYAVPAQAFAREVSVLSLAGGASHRIADLPVAEHVPIQGVPTGPRGVRWLPNAPAKLMWTEALDGGDPKAKVPHRDRLVTFEAPFAGEPSEWGKLEHRFQGAQFDEAGRLTLVNEFIREKRWVKTWAVRGATFGGEGTVLLHDRSTQDAYGDPGQPVQRTTAQGDAVLMLDGDALLLRGTGATPDGDRPFLNRVDLANGTSETLFRCADGAYEQVLAVLDDHGTSLLVRHESPTEPGRLEVRSGGETRVLAEFPDAAAELTRGITKRLLTYARRDGVQLSGTLYLPPGHEEGKQWPLFVWAYPREFNDADNAGQVRGSQDRYTRLGGTSPLLLLLAGYAVLDDASMPIVGPVETANDTLIEQLVMNGEAAIEAVAALGVVDRRKIAIGGHSYGAFMTANLLAHSDLFAAGIARSGAYNRTLTPFGFQNEHRTLWQAPAVYAAVSPFMHAHAIDEPLLMIHGAADNNPGTFTMQSQRLYHAIKGHGGIARLVLLPHESHGYRAQESVLHVMAETVEWLDRYVKHANGPDAR